VNHAICTVLFESVWLCHHMQSPTNYTIVWRKVSNSFYHINITAVWNAFVHSTWDDFMHYAGPLGKIGQLPSNDNCVSWNCASCLQWDAPFFGSLPTFCHTIYCKFYHYCGFLFADGQIQNDYFVLDDDYF